MTTFMDKIFESIHTAIDSGSIQAKNKKGYRYPVIKIPENFKDKVCSLNWSKEEYHRELIYANKSVGGFMVSIKIAQKPCLYFTLKKENHEWSTISIPLDESALNILEKELPIHFDLTGTVTRKKQKCILNDNVTLYLVDIKQLGKYIEIEGSSDEHVDNFLKEYSLSKEDLAKYYEKTAETLG
ncbi:MAG: hypothetical protein FWD05_14035 [Oscillospiraceae bacterium]|nr:hypothetical protein [Oscillospiraceae bacterium]